MNELNIQRLDSMEDEIPASEPAETKTPALEALSFEEAWAWTVAHYRELLKSLADK